MSLTELQREIGVNEWQHSYKQDTSQTKDCDGNREGQPSAN
jgi:hypothetical protein